MTESCKTVNINGLNYVREDLVGQLKPAVDSDGRPFVIVRSHGAGVFAGYVRERDTEHERIVLDGCIRLWQWTGCSLSQVANDGTAGTGENKFSMPTNGHEILRVVEIIPATEKARIAIQAVKTWKK